MEPAVVTRRQQRCLCPFDRLPDEIVMLIFSFLSVLDVVRSSEVCQRFHRLLTDNVFWKQVYVRAYQDLAPTIPDLELLPTWNDKFVHTYNVINRAHEHWKAGDCWTTCVDQKAHGVKVFCLDVRGSALVNGDSTGTVTLLRANTDDGRLTFRRPRRGGTFKCGSSVYCIQGSSDDAHHFVAGCADGTVQIWTTRSCMRLTTATTHNNWVFGLQFDTNKLLTAAYDGEVRMYDFWSQKVTDSMYHPKGASCVVFDNDFAVTGGRDAKVHGWDLRAPAQSVLQLVGHRELVWAVQMYQHTVISAGFDGCGLVWDLRKLAMVRSLDHGYGNTQVRALAFDMSRIVTGDTNRDVKVWSWDESYNYTLGNLHSRYLSCAYLAPHFMVTGAWDGTTRLWSFLPEAYDQNDVAQPDIAPEPLLPSSV